MFNHVACRSWVGIEKAPALILASFVHALEFMGMATVNVGNIGLGVIECIDD
jgi:hypothetical protein